MLGTRNNCTCFTAQVDQDIIRGRLGRPSQGTRRDSSAQITTIGTATNIRAQP